MFANIIILLILIPLFIVVSNVVNKKKLNNESCYNIVEGSISEGDLLGNIFSNQGISADESHLITNSLTKIFNVRRCGVGNRWKIYFDEEDKFVKFEYYDGPIDFYVVEADRENNVYNASANQIETDRFARGVKGEISNSLYYDMSSLGVNSEIIIQFAEIFASKIDFFTDCQKGDEFKVLWDTHFDTDGIPLKDVQISAASYTRGNETFQAFFFETPDKKSGYYDENGRSVESLFLKAPLSYRRISSYFTHKRFHPILKRYRPHLGIDYAAPHGTPVSTIGDGVVVDAGRRRDGLGITVRIKHPNGYVSWYGHLSKISKGVSKGSRVKKGQVIGNVGATGMATGPHLDFRLQQKDGKFINFLSLKTTPSNPLSDKYMAQFKVSKDGLLALIEQLKQKEIIVFKNHKGKSV